MVPENVVYDCGISYVCVHVYIYCGGKWMEKLSHCYDSIQLTLVN